MERPRIQQNISVCVCVCVCVRERERETFLFSEIVLKLRVQLLEIYRKTTSMNIIKSSLIHSIIYFQ